MSATPTILSATPIVWGTSDITPGAVYRCPGLSAFEKRKYCTREGEIVRGSYAPHDLQYGARDVHSIVSVLVNVLLLLLGQLLMFAPVDNPVELFEAQDAVPVFIPLRE